MIKKIIILIFIASALASCVAVKEYEKMNINDPDMQLSDLSSQRFESVSQAYREIVKNRKIEK